jgi:site-specific DNA-cytosine methylase
MEEKGESGQTFGGMIEWIEKAQPPIVIIENVYGAPWDQKVEIFEERGYAATFLRLDTKDYYIPHTRQRGYLFAVRRSSSKKTNDDETVKCWEEDVKNLKRPASARLDEYMLPNDDPRVLRGRARLTVESCSGAGESRSGRTDWTKCETRHQKSRSEEELGNQRPLTGWSDSGNTTLPSFAWNEWANAQVHRIHDLMDINTIRMAKVGMDCTYKTMVWNLSQNVDRDTMGKVWLPHVKVCTDVLYPSLTYSLLFTLSHS